MNGRNQTVHVFSLVLPGADCPKDRRRYKVKWRVDGRDRTRSFKTRALADRFRADLLVAASEGHRFDPATGLPQPWQRSLETWFTWSQQWLELKWPHWAGHSRRSAVEALVSFTPWLVSPGAPPAPAELADWLREEGYRVGSTEWSRPLPWLTRWSVPLDDLNPEIIEHALRQATTKRDGTVVAATVARRRKNLLGTVLAAAVRRGVAHDNPIHRIEWRNPSSDQTVDISTVPTAAEVLTIADHVAALPSGGARYGALFACVGIAGMRPSEALGLAPGDLHLPRSGWGLARLRGASPAPGSRYTDSGERVERKGLKQRAANSMREVPLAPELVLRLRTHISRFALPDLVIPNAAGAAATSFNYTPVWVRARPILWPAGHPLASTTVYDLRHSAATTMLRAGVSPAETARRLGHSVDILLRVYAGVAADERAKANALLDSAHGASALDEE